MMDYASYFADFNTNDDAAIAPRWFTDDVLVEGPMPPCKNRDEWVANLQESHRGVRETITPVTVLLDGDRMAAEVQIRFDAQIDRPDHVTGPLMKGETRQVYCYVFYTLRDGLISHLRFAARPANG